MTPNPIEPQDNLIDVVVRMAEGNPGATTVMAGILKHAPDLGIVYLLHLDDMNIRGSAIWVAFKDHCDSDVAKLVECLTTRDPDMVATVNDAIDRGLCGVDVPRAVTHGGSTCGH